VRIDPLGENADERRATALAQLAILVDLYDRGMREPLPLYCASSAAYAQALTEGGDAVAAGSGAWNSEYSFDKEDAELEHQLVLGGVLTFDDLLAERPRPDERGDGWDMAQATRLGRLARRMWDGLLEREEVTSA
jgi:exodeoxyribonuclease V gamma subunit